jgi:hypothetical protein
VIVHRLISKNSSGGAIRCGAPLAQDDLKPLLSSLAQPAVHDGLILDFAGIEAVNGSYARATVAWLIRCARTHRAAISLRKRNADPWAVKPFAIERIFVQNLAPDVREEIDGLLCQPSFRLPCLEALKVTSAQVSHARLLGHLDRQLRECLARLYEIGGEATTLDLHEQYSGDNVQVTAWNNRLAALHERLLVTRRKDGRSWIYETVTQHLKSYGI